MLNCHDTSSTSTSNKFPPILLTRKERLHHWETPIVMLFQATTLCITILKILCSQSNYNIHLNSHTTAAEISWYVSGNTGTAHEDLNYYKIKQHPWSSSRWSFTPTPQIFLILTLLPTLEFTYVSETWKWQLVYVGENQLYFGRFHGKTEVNILCLDPKAKSKWTENSQLFLSWAKCAICSHKVHLLVATVLQHYHKVPCDQGLVHKSRKILWVTESPKQ